MSICDKPSETIQDIFRIGVTQHYHCKFDLKKLTTPNKFERPQIGDFFFELYLRDYNDDLIDVPVLIEDTAGANGGYPNRGKDKAQWILTRRFFMFDTVSGIPQNQYPNGTPVVVRYPKRMTLVIVLNMDE